MTKAYYTRPDKEIRFVKPDKESEVYEYYMMVPVKLGIVTRHGTARLTTDDGAGPFTNHSGALRHLLKRAGEDESLAGGIWVTGNKTLKRISVSGVQISMQGKWKEFCELFKIDPKDESAVKKLYKLTEADIERIGLEGIAG